MKKILITLTCLLLMIQFSGCGSNEPNRSPEVHRKANTINDTKALNDSEKDECNLELMKKNGLTVFEEQSFWVDLENWGKVKFISGWYLEESKRVLKMGLIDHDQNILYKFSDLLEDTPWNLYKVRAISFNDINRDGKKDIIVIAEYVTGAGPTGATPFPVAGIYFQKDKEFVRVQKLDEQITDFESIDMILKFVEGKDIKINN